MSNHSYRPSALFFSRHFYSKLLHHADLRFLYVCFPIREGSREVVHSSHWYDNLICGVRCTIILEFSMYMFKIL